MGTITCLSSDACAVGLLGAIDAAFRLTAAAAAAAAAAAPAAAHAPAAAASPTEAVAPPCRSGFQLNECKSLLQKYWSPIIRSYDKP